MDFEKWVKEREQELFQIENFKRIGKDNDPFFMTLAFMGNASQKMSIAFTLTEMIKDFPKELEDEFREVARNYHRLQERVRELQKRGNHHESHSE